MECSFLSFDSNVVFEVIWQISGKGLLRITRYIGEITVNEAAHTLSAVAIATFLAPVSFCQKSKYPHLQSPK